MFGRTGPVLIVCLILGIFACLCLLPPQETPVTPWEDPPLAVNLIRTYGTITVEVDHVYDGDTIIANIPGWPPLVGEMIGVRLRGYDSPEMRDPKRAELARKAKDRMAELLQGRKVEARNMGRDKYFRINADLYADGLDVGEVLAREGLVRKYTGHGAKPWQ